MDRRLEWTFLERGHTDGQKTNEKILNILHHQVNTHPNHDEIPPYTFQKG